MTKAEGKRLKVGDRVHWKMVDVEPHEDADGTVREVGYAALRVGWDDGQSSSLFMFSDPQAQWNCLSKIKATKGEETHGDI